MPTTLKHAKESKDIMPEDERIESILAHLDNEVASGTMRMSGEVDEAREGEPLVSHRGSRIYGDDASRIVAKLDMYSDLTLKKDDTE